MKDYEKSLSFVQGMIAKHCRHMDYGRAIYWLGVANAVNHNIPKTIEDMLIAAFDVKPDFKSLSKEIDIWLGGLQFTNAPFPGKTNE